MGRIRIITDSTADLPEKLVEQNGITVVPLKVIFNGRESFRDGIDIKPEQFYHRLMENKELPKTSQPSPSDFVSVYQKLAMEGDNIISIHISSALSGTVQSARMAKEMLSGGDIEVIDSASVSMGLGFIVLEAARAAEQGKTKKEILDLISYLRSKIQVFFIVDTLEYLMRGGRIGKAQAFWGTILHIKPLLFIKDGTIHPYEKVRGKTKAIDRLVQVVQEIVGEKRVKCSLVHGMDEAGLEQLHRKTSSSLRCSETIIAKLGAVVGTHGGPGVLGIVFVPEDNESKR